MEQYFYNALTMFIDMCLCDYKHSNNFNKV